MIWSAWYSVGGYFNFVLTRDVYPGIWLEADRYIIVTSLKEIWTSTEHLV